MKLPKKLWQGVKKGLAGLVLAGALAVGAKGEIIEVKSFNKNVRSNGQIYDIIPKASDPGYGGESKDYESLEVAKNGELYNNKIILWGLKYRESELIKWKWVGGLQNKKRGHTNDYASGFMNLEDGGWAGSWGGLFPGNLPGNPGETVDQWIAGIDENNNGLIGYYNIGPYDEEYCPELDQNLDKNKIYFEPGEYRGPDQILWGGMDGYGDVTGMHSIAYIDVRDTSVQQGDANLDGSTNVFDLAILGNNYNENTTAHWTDADFNHDMKVDVFDLAILANNYQPLSTITSNPVPEPGLVSLLALATPLLLKKRNPKSSRKS